MQQQQQQSTTATDAHRMDIGDPSMEDQQQKDIQAAEQSNDNEDEQISAPEDDANDYANLNDVVFAFESSQEIIHHMCLWLQEVASIPTQQHIDMLNIFCQQQIMKHRNLSVVHVLLRAVRRYAREHHDVWKEAYNQLLQSVQPIVYEHYQSYLPIHAV
jgi:hypothetical protein